ncbi:MAG: 1-acyl-sn-glycerol-3-phosphate acyltransferase [Planctomycetes bacterium]|nr:1-acyl-sn-glycerol-3-phosphate acyltransferase [Planctomycetota bacterium]
MRVLLLPFHLLHLLVLAAWSVGCIVVASLSALVLWNREAPLVFARRVWSPGIFFLTFSRLRLEPLPALDWTRPYVFVMNHQSMCDAPAVFLALPVNLRFVGKQGLKYVPFLGWYMSLTGMIFVNRSDRAQAVESLAAAAARVRAGASILAFAEGTRSRDGSILPFKKGPFVLALQAGVPVVPIAIEGSRQVFPPDGLSVRPGIVRLKVGTPIPTEGRSLEDREALLRETRAAIIGLHREIGGRGDAGNPKAQSPNPKKTEDGEGE